MENFYFNFDKFSEKIIQNEENRKKTLSRDSSVSSQRRLLQLYRENILNRLYLK